MLGGVTVNVILAFVIYSMILMVWGERKVPANSLKYGIVFNDPIFKGLGFKNGDKILAIDEKPVDDYQDILRKLIVVDNDVTIERDGKIEKLKMPVDLIGTLVEKRRKSGGALISPRIPVIVLGIEDTSAAYKAGLRKSDQITAINNQPTKYFDEFATLMEDKKKSDNITLTVKRVDSLISIPLTLSIDGKVGFNSPFLPEQFDSLGIYSYTIKNYTFAEAIPGGVRRAGVELGSYIDQFRKILSPETGAYKGVGGFKAMGSVFSGTSWDWEHFWTITALFSIILAFMNLLPIPALDGGHVLFTLYEMVSGRKPSDKFLEYAQIVGMILLLGLMLYANGNDWFGWGR
ncbi:MAG: site-2 protease family protein [Ferruginibacter sp.]